jgi:hypothetical protein
LLTMDPSPTQTSDSSRGTTSRPHVNDGNGVAQAQPKSRVKKPRIDIDDQISEANRLSEVLRKVAQAAKTTAKNGTRAKQRLVRKAGKLSSEDLERIAVLKRCGLFTGANMETDGASQPGTPASGSQAGIPVDKSVVLDSMEVSLSKIPGAADIMRTLGATTLESAPPPIRRSALSSTIVKATSAAVTAGGKAVLALPLPPAMVKPLASSEKEKV